MNCLCEHADHMEDEQPRRAHAYQAVPAGRHQTPVGRVCDQCADGHMAPYLSPVPELRAKATRVREGTADDWQQGWRGQLAVGRRVVWTCSGHPVHWSGYQARQCAHRELDRLDDATQPDASQPGYMTPGFRIPEEEPDPRAWPADEPAKHRYYEEN
jgi:hypothetical protein